MSGMGMTALLQPSGSSRPLVIGLVNNMSSARATTERQFKRLLAAAGIDRDVRLQCFCAGEVGASAGYADIEDLFKTTLDGIIVTGAEPQSANLRGEPLWRAVVRLIDWAEDHGTPVIWSCLAAHAAVLCLDGIDRRPLAKKLSGVFPSEIVETWHPLMRGLESPCLTPHSRWNDLLEGDLRRAGYSILVKSDEAGVGVFGKTRRAPFLFLQGHPEYEADTLLREFQRDARRLELRERGGPLSVPRHYFSAEAECYAESLRKPSGAEGMLREDAVAALGEWGRALGPAPWLPTSAVLYRNWLLDVALRKDGIAPQPWTRPGMETYQQNRLELGLTP